MALGIGVLVLIALMAMLLVACGEEETSTTTTAQQATTTTAAQQQTTTSATMAETTTTVAAGPVYGGILKMVHNSPPAIMGMWAKTGPTDEAAQFPGVERIMKFAPGRKLVPDLAETVVEDADAKTITVKLHEGVMFTDGTELTAEVAKWNYDNGAASGKLQFADQIESFEIVDKYNYVIHLKTWHNQMLQSLGWVPMYSMDAYMKSGTTDEERQAWATENLVATGPFILKEFNRDQSVIWEKNPNYWREGQPYLDGIEVTFLTDPATAQPVFESGQADIWQAADAQARSALVQGLHGADRLGRIPVPLDAQHRRPRFAHGEEGGPRGAGVRARQRGDLQSYRLWLLLPHLCGVS